MLNAKKWLAMLLAVSLLFNFIPLNTLAVEPPEDSLVTAQTPSASQTVTPTVAPGVEPQGTPGVEPQVTPTVAPEASSTVSQTFENEGGEAVLLADSIGDLFADEFLAILETQSMTANIVKGSDGVVTLTIGDGAASILALLSQQQQTAEKNYQNWNINFNITGTLDLTGTDYQGLGDSEYPFKGKLTGNINGLKSSKTIFKALSVEANLKGVQITWVGAKDIPILAETLTATADAGEVNMPLASATSFSPYIGTLNGGTGLVTLPVLDYSGVDITKISTDISTGNLGLILKTMDAGTQVQVGTVRLPAEVDLRGSENVGGLVGHMANNAVLYITQPLTMNLSLSGQNTGGLVGSLDCASIQFESSASVTINAQLDATQAAGGIAGVVRTETGPLDTDANVVLDSVKAKGNENAGVLYGSCTATGIFDSFVGVSIGNTAEVSGKGSCGGLFGTLTLSENGKCNIIGSPSSLLGINSTLTDAGNTTKYGGIAGTLTGDARANALVVDNCNVTANIAVGNDAAHYPKYLGGIVAEQRTITLDTKNSAIKVTEPKTFKDTDRGFGGVCAYLDDNALLVAEKMAVETTSYLANLGGGGVVGSAHKGSIVYLKTSLDLSKCQLSTNATTGQIVGSQDCSLIYAPEVEISRLKSGSFNGMELDDIGNYGELYRLENLMSVDNNYSVSFPHTLSKTDEEYVLSTALDYACLALAWQSRGYFHVVNGIDESNWTSLKNSTITLGSNIVLTDCGIGGLTRDNNSDDDTFTGTLNGAGHKITLDIGSENSANIVAKGDGRIYWHNATGLFAVLDSNANVMNLTLDGNIRVSNNRLGLMHSGGLAALMKNTRGTKDSVLSEVSTNVIFHANANGANQLYLGGLIGLISNADTTIDFKNNTALHATINISHSGNGSHNHFGGAVGAIAMDAGATITCNGATLSGNIITSTGTPNNLYAGGLVGTIFPSNSKTRTINIASLTVNGFALTGNASERMGGILGGIWADTDVNVDGLSVANTTLIANGKAELGGLVYRASGKWNVRSVNLSGLTIDAGSANALGLLVCHGEPYQEPINGASSVGGLYLEMTTPWSSGYAVPSIKNTFSGAVFDEFVAYTGYRELNTTNYQITHNGGGIISLKTENNGTVNMTEGERNTYVNRTTVGQSKQTNPNSRYYYNLPEVKSGCDGGDIDTAQELLIWSVYRYAASNLKENFSFNGVETGNIGGTSPTTRANFNMNGLSYYPIDITNESITVQYADVSFYNNDIENKENNNKSTRGTDENHSQHYTMHCGLFANYNGNLQTVTQSQTYEMKVNGVTFAGKVGVVNGGSGAFLCGTVKGESREGKTATCNVILADADEASKGVSLNGLSVMPEGDYTPALINCFESYSGLEANYVTTTENQTMRSGSSLIGNVGGENATNVKIAFAGTIKLPETGVFTKATLLNSLRYVNGSATYNFTKAKDYQEDTFIHNTTHGKELSESVEYEGKCGYYDDDTDNTLCVVDGNKNNNFSGYLPYVALSPATKDDNHTLEKGWHELAVNIHFEPLIIGCGTYGHPYQVTAKELREAAGYINTGVAATGWTVRVCSDSDYHTNEDEHDCLLTYQNGGWKNADNSPYEGNVREYLQKAYYQLVYAKDENDIEETSITLSNFQGIGTTSDWAFKGVITGKQSNGTYATVTLTSGSAAFIKYSYGSVVRDVNIVLNQGVTLTRPSWSRGDAEQAPKTFFGGVIGCVLGGDNIIENVNVTTDSKFNLSATGTNPYLIPIGGYVGVIAGGGVLFRGTISSNSGISGTDAQLYKNPIIGRVLGGYAFYEGSGSAPNNGDKNYKINQIVKTNTGLSWEGSTLTVNSQQGLLLLSAIVSSGGGSTASNAYANGIARNACYDQIGSETVPDDYNIAMTDGVAYPYLLQNYVSGSASATICTNTTNGIAIKFKESATFDMNGYDNGYRGLSARYVSNAAFVRSGNNTPVDASAVVMRVKTFDGQGANVLNINMDVKEYADDDFHAASLGGIFNIVWTQEQSGGGGEGSNFAQNLTLQDCNVKLQYINSNGIDINEATFDSFDNVDGRRAVSVGGFIGMANDIEADSNSQKTVNHNYLFTNISIEGTGSNKCTITGPNGVGGLIGTTAMASTGVTGYPGILLSNGKWALFGPSFLNCSYSNIEVTGGLAAGGLIGDAYASGSGTVPGFSGLGISYGNKAFLCYASCTVTQDALIVGQNSTITAKAKGSIAAGVFGAAGMRVGVNDPNANENTGLSIFNNTNDIRPLRLTDVTVKVSQENYNASESNPDNGANNAYAGGIIARIGSVNPSCFYNINIRGGEISSELATSSYVGGVVGSGYTNSTITIQDCYISDNNISGTYAGGFLGRGHSATSFSLTMTDSSIKESTVTGTSYAGTSYAGGLVGSASSKYYLYNILIKNTSITANNMNNAGRLFGLMNFNNTGDDFYVYAAGISVYADKERVTIPSEEGCTDKSRSYIGYISYADYAGTETEVTGEQYPYITVNPNFRLTADKLLTGDAVGKIQGDSFESVAARIWADQKTGATGKKNLAPYLRASEIVNANGKVAPEVSTFQAVQGCGPDLPVLVLKGGDAGVITDYLNVITNGGYSEAPIATQGGTENKVDTTVTVYYYDETSGTFSVAENNQLQEQPASVYYDNGIKVRGNSYDNTRYRFSLVEASFDVQRRKYTVSVPVVVIRELQYNFMATFSYGAEFHADTYTNLRTHVLESTGNPFAAYLTYEYNREQDEVVDYDWQSYMDAGGDMLAVDKMLTFSSGLPAGTQMTLIDCQDGNQAYFYKTTIHSNTSASVKLSDFIAVSDKMTTFRASMADILCVEAAENVDGKYVVETDPTKATLRLKGTYYRLYQDGDEAARYSLTVPDLSKDAPRENYYLVITVPEQEDSDFYINGGLSSSLKWEMPSSGTQVHRYDGSTDGVGNNDESTYQISAGYRQEITSLTESGEAINLITSEKNMQVYLKDTITFSNQQAYGNNDQLFVKFDVSLQEHSLLSPVVTEHQFPAGTTGTVHFFIQDSNGNYYTPSGSSWSKTTTETEAASYPWTSRGANMELLVSGDGTTALDLAGVRQMIKASQSTGSSNIIITAKMDITFGSQEVLNAAIPGSAEHGTDIWAKLHYVGRISTQANTLDYSSNRKAVDDNAKYYRGVQYQAVLSMDASQIDQLGINPLELVPKYLSNDRKTSQIDLIAALDLENLPNAEELLQQTASIRFDLSLLRRNGDNYIEIPMEEAPNYIAFKWLNQLDGWSWTISQNQFYADGEIISSDLFDGEQFTIPLTAYVSTVQKNYSNYKIQLKVSFLNSTGDRVSVALDDKDAYVVYTFACIRPSFYEP